MELDVYELIKKIRACPAMYLGKDSISLLKAFLDGYTTAAHESEISLVKEIPPFGEIHDWVAMKLGHYASTAGWAAMLLEAEKNDESRALELFFEYLDEFKQRKATVIFWAVFDQTRNWRSQNIDGKYIKMPKPALVHIVKYTKDKGVFIRYIGEQGELVDREEYCPSLINAFFCTDWILKKDEWNKGEP